MVKFMPKSNFLKIYRYSIFIFWAILGFELFIQNLNMVRLSVKILTVNAFVFNLIRFALFLIIKWSILVFITLSFTPKHRNRKPFLHRTQVFPKKTENYTVKWNVQIDKMGGQKCNEHINKLRTVIWPRNMRT